MPVTSSQVGSTESKFFSPVVLVSHPIASFDVNPENRQQSTSVPSIPRYLSQEAYSSLTLQGRLTQQPNQITQVQVERKDDQHADVSGPLVFLLAGSPNQRCQLTSYPICKSKLFPFRAQCGVHLSMNPWTTSVVHPKDAAKAVKYSPLPMSENGRGYICLIMKSNSSTTQPKPTKQHCLCREISSSTHFRKGQELNNS